MSWRGAYKEALLAEIQRAGCVLKGPADTVFLGGGTPSTADPETLTDILAALRDAAGVVRGAEITAEMNPRTAAPDWLEAAAAAGVNRISMGLQAAQDHHLRRLGRRHTVADFAAAFADVRRAGFHNISIDLIYGLPAQTAAEWLESLAFACGLGPEHISCYALSVEEGTPLAARIEHGELPAPDEDLAADMYVLAQKYLRGRGYLQYEISNFAVPGRACRHNLTYWTLGDYLGLGAGAHSMLGRFRFANTPDVRRYIELLEASCTPVAAAEYTDATEKQREFFMLTTRLNAGFSAGEFESRFGFPFKEKTRNGLGQAVRDGLLRLRDGRYVPTDLGLRFQNRLAQLLMADV